MFFWTFFNFFQISTFQISNLIFQHSNNKYHSNTIHQIKSHPKKPHRLFAKDFILTFAAVTFFLSMFIMILFSLLHFVIGFEKLFGYCCFCFRKRKRNSSKSRERIHAEFNELQRNENMKAGFTPKSRFTPRQSILKNSPVRGKKKSDAGDKRNYNNSFNTNQFGMSSGSKGRWSFGFALTDF